VQRFEIFVNLKTMSVAFLLIGQTMSISTAVADSRSGRAASIPTQSSLPILLDRSTLSGIGLTEVKSNPSNSTTKAYARTVFSGDLLEVLVRAWSPGIKHIESSAEEEFVYVINGRARLKDDHGAEEVFESGESFIVPKGFSGSWNSEAEQLYQELVVVTKDRRSSTTQMATTPIRLNASILSGIGLAKSTWPYNPTREMYRSPIYKGPELTISVVAIAPDVTHFGGEMHEEFVQVLNGTATLTPDGHAPVAFYTRDMFAVPNGFIGTWSADGNPLYRELAIGRSK
jgi:uncharacterized cupin superfamily protein